VPIKLIRPCYKSRWPDHNWRKPYFWGWRSDEEKVENKQTQHHKIAIKRREKYKRRGKLSAFLVKFWMTDENELEVE